MVRRLAVGLLLLLSVTFLGSVLGCGDQLPDGAIAQVGDNLISQDQLDKLLVGYEVARVAPDKEKQPGQYQLFKQKCVEYLVILEVMYQEALNFNVTVTSEDVNSRIDQIRGMFLGNEEKFNAALVERDMTLDQLTQSVREVIWFEKMKAVVTADVSVREEEVRAYYQEHIDEYVEQESRKVRHILISPFLDAAGNTVSEIPTQTDWDAAESEAAKVRSEIQNGADFVTEVELYSDDESSSGNGGGLGAVMRGQTVPAFEQAVFALQKGELSQPVRSPSGYHIIQVTDITPAQQRTYDAVKEQIRSILLEEKQAAAWQQWLTETQQRLGVIYRKGYAPPGAWSGPPLTTTSIAGETGETSTGETTTTSTGAE